MKTIPCKFCNTPIEQPETGRPRTFCSPAHGVAWRRAQKSSSQPSNSILQQLPKLAAKAHANRTISTVPPHILPYMPTTNDANISAILNHKGPSSTLALPFPAGEAIPLLTLPTLQSQPAPTTLYSDEPTF